MSKVLVVDDNASIREALELLFELNDIDCVLAEDPAEALRLLNTRVDISLVLQDMNFQPGEHGGLQGRDLFKRIRACDADLPVVLMTAWTQLEMAIELIKEGASDYIAKPWDNDKLLVTVRNLLELSSLKRLHRQRNQSLRKAQVELERNAKLCGIVYQSEIMHATLELAVKVARSDVPILITGPNGVGKEKIADIVQSNSEVRSGPYVKVNVGALPDDLMEAELFGAEAGAYTGISKRRIGRFESADGGTLFLDELGNLSASGQAKLLRVLQTGEYERLGSSVTQKCKVRIISATNANLVEAVKSGKFREDLFYRLNVIELKIPPLVERVEDIEALLQKFLGADYSVSTGVLNALKRYPWPGNVRELENACQRARVVAQSQALQVQDFGLDSLAAETDLSKASLEPDKRQIEQALQESKGIIAQAARQLGMSRQALYRRMEKFDISEATWATSKE